MAASKRAATLVMVAVHLLLLLQRAAMQQPQQQEEEEEQAVVGPTLVKGVTAVRDQARAAGAQLQAGSKAVPVPEEKEPLVGRDCAPSLGTCRSRSCCDKSNFDCVYTQVFGFVLAATCRPRATCDDTTACTLNLKRLRGTLFPPQP